MRIPGLKKDMLFYELLEEQAEAAHKAAQEFHMLTVDSSKIEECVDRIVQIERGADDMTHQLANKLDSTFVTPLDKEDLRALSGALDDITDIIEAGTQRIVLYGLTTIRQDLEPLVGLLVRTTEATCEVVKGLRHMRRREDMNHRFIKVHELENEGDRAFRQALAKLFNNEAADPLVVIKWKEIYDRVETAVDKCEDVAKVVESVAVKYA